MSDVGGAGQVLAGRYRLVRQLAQGGMAVVWEGRDEILARAVAIKMPHARLAVDPVFRERFRREAVAAARLAHPGIVATYDTGVDGATDFIVMELVPGRTIRDLVAGGPVAAEMAVHLVAQIADALEVAHRAGVIHRDIKPANLLLIEDGSAPRVKVADFGVAWAQETFERDDASNGLTKEGLVVGTARYLAPEQVTAGVLDGRTDVYAVGCVLHELLAGQPPFARETDLATALAQMTEVAPSLGSLGITVPPDLEQLVLDCLAKAPDDRPASAQNLAQRLRSVALPPLTATFAPLQPSTAAGTALTVALAVPSVGPERAPGPAPPPRSQPGVPPKSAPKPPPIRSQAPLYVVGGLVLAALVTALFVVTMGSDNSDGTRLPPTSTPAGRLNVASLRSFDPEGDAQENDAQLPRLVDGNPATTWSTDRYSLRAPFGGLKSGVGVVLVLDGTARLGQLRVRSASQDWKAQVYAADAPPATLAGWGQPIGQSGVVKGDLELDLGRASGAAVLVWFTNPGPTGQVVVSEIELGSR